MIQKTTLVNALFVLAFPLYGIGNYLSFKINFSEGIIISVSAFLAILLFWLVDRMYQGPTEKVLNRKFTVGFLFTLSIAWSMWVALFKSFPSTLR